MESDKQPIVPFHRLFQFTIRDWFWLALVVAVIFGWIAEQNSRDLGMNREFDETRRRDARRLNELVEEREQLKTKLEAATVRELDLETTIKALKLRLGEDQRANAKE